MKKPIAIVLLAFGTLCFFLALYQFNQYYTAQAAGTQLLAYYEKLGAESGLSAADLSATLDSTRATLAGTSNSMIILILLDAVLGIVCFAIGFSIYPKER